MYTLYIANKNYSSWSLRPWVLMQTLSIPFEEKLSPFNAVSNREKYKVFSPSALVPCLHDGDVIVWDSLAITEYLAEQNSGVWPEDPVARAWARSAAAEMHAGFGALRQECSMSCGVRIKLNRISPALQQNIERLNELWGEGLSRFGGPFLTGDKFTAVDAFYAPVAFRIQTYGLPVNDQSLSYVKNLLALESMQQWEAAALQEVWRDEDHEKDVLAAGTLLTDMRKS